MHTFFGEVCKYAGGPVLPQEWAIAVHTFLEEVCKCAGGPVLPQEWASAVHTLFGKYASMQEALSSRRSGLAQCILFWGRMQVCRRPCPPAGVG